MTPALDARGGLDELAAALEAQLRSSSLERDRSIGELTTYRVGGRAALSVEVLDAEDLAALAGVMAGSTVPVLVIGRGSNLLVGDAGFAGLVIRLGEHFADVVELDPGVVEVGGAASLPSVARRLTADGLHGFEWAVGVPGSLGGAVRMTAGGHGSDMRASVRRASVLDLRTGRVEDVAAVDLDFSYRSSSIAPHHLVVRATLGLEPGDPETGMAEIGEIVRWRREHQPGGQNAGSVFTNPGDDSAGRLIDAAGLKGFRIGTAEVSTKHANFIQADPGGSADDIVALMAEVRRQVRAATGVSLHAETRMVGFDHDQMDDAGGVS